MTHDKLVECKRCGGNACYEQHLENNITTWLCWGCGFTTSTVMKEGSEAVTQAVQTSPELYKDIAFTDQDNNVWLPATITLPNRGMVFVDGTHKDNWRWASVGAIPLAKEDKKASENQTHKMDMKNIKHFEQKDFMNACEHIGMFEVV